MKFSFLTVYFTTKYTWYFLSDFSFLDFYSVFYLQNQTTNKIRSKIEERS